MNIKFSAIMVAAIIVLIFHTNIQVQADTVEYDLTIANETLNVTGKMVQGMSINGSVPGPVLRFKEGDLARIRVHNQMTQSTSIHWHGVLVPPGMDGVPYVSFPPIEPGTTFTYEFPIRQNGTYWYHSHSGLQEQSGVYGAIVIYPREEMHPNQKDYVVLLSDWTDDDPHTVNRTLKRGSEWYALEKGSSQSIIGAGRLGMLDDYFKRELQRMPAMDIADVAYDRFLSNGKPEIALAANPHEIIRIRIVDGSASTFFHLEFAGGRMTVVSADGQNVEPIQLDRMLIGVAETYDVLIQLPDEGAYELRSTAHDGSGHSSIWIGHGKRHPAPDVPKPNLYYTMGELDPGRIFALTPAGSMGMEDSKIKAGEFDQPGMAGMGHMHDSSMDMSNQQGGSYNKDSESMDISGGMSRSMNPSENSNSHNSHSTSMNTMDQTDHSTMSDNSHTMKKKDLTDHPERTIIEPPGTAKPYGTNYRPMAADVSAADSLAIDGEDQSRPWPPYAKLRATKPTAFSKGPPVREIRLTLDGDMERYVWMLNNKVLSESDSIRIREGEIARFIMINRTMMHHPMHLHGHFFRVVNGQGDYAPLKHTVDVGPMSTTVIEFKANEVGDWFFHCHLLYHMKAGMTRIVHYDNFSPDDNTTAVRSNIYKDPWYFWGEADALSNMTEGYLSLSDSRNTIKAMWEAGWQRVDELEWESIVSWNRYFNRFISAYLGVDFGEAIETNRVILGIDYLLPLNIEFNAFVGTDRGARFSLAKHFEITPRIGVTAHGQYDTETKWEGELDLTYVLTKSFDLVGRWHSEHGFGAGVRVRF